MTSNPYIIERRAASLEPVILELDAIRWDWAAKLFADCDLPGASERAANFAAEARLVAATLCGKRRIGDEDDNPFANAEFAPMRENLPVRS